MNENCEGYSYDFFQGAKINARIKELEEQLEKFKQPDQIDGLAEILDNLKIVEKRQTAKFFKQKEFEDEKKTPNTKEKFRAHRNDAYNSKAKENQPIKTVSTSYYWKQSITF